MLMSHTLVNDLEFFSSQIVSHVAQINTGLCNRNFVVTSNQGQYLLRLFGPALDSQRRCDEFSAQALAYSAKIAPQPFVHYLPHQLPSSWLSWFKAHALPNHGLMLSAFFNGSRWSDMVSYSDDMLAALSNQLARLHQLSMTSAPKAALPMALLKGYWQDYGEKSLQARQRYQQVCAALTQLKLDNRSLIHGDINPTNLLINANEYQIIDWEFSCQGDYHLDLASAIVELNLDTAQSHWFISQYEGRRAGVTVDSQKLTLCKIYYLGFCWLWQPPQAGLLNEADHQQRYSDKLDYLLAINGAEDSAKRL